MKYTCIAKLVVAWLYVDLKVVDKKQLTYETYLSRQMTSIQCRIAVNATSH